MTARELMAVLATAAPDAIVFVADEDVDAKVASAAVLSADDVEYTQVPASPGDVLLSLEDWR